MTGVRFRFTVTVTVAVLVHPEGVVPVTVYAVVAAGVTVGEPTKLPGFHKNVVPTTVLVALNVDELPRQIDGGVAVGVIVGIGFTVTVTVAVFVHPAGVVPVTV